MRRRRRTTSTSVGPVRIIYFLCLFGVTIEDVIWFGNNTALKCPQICSIAFSIRGDNAGESSKRQDGELNLDYEMFMQKQERYWSIFQLVRCLFRYTIGVMWLWFRNKELLLDRSPSDAIFIWVVVFICVIVVVFMCLFVIRRLGGGNDNKPHKPDYEFVLEDYNQRLYSSIPERTEKPFLALLAIFFFIWLLYKAINMLSEVFWGQIGRRMPFNVKVQTSTTLNVTDSSTGLNTDYDTMHSEWQAMIEQNDMIQSSTIFNSPIFNITTSLNTDYDTMHSSWQATIEQNDTNDTIQTSTTFNVTDSSTGLNTDSDTMHSEWQATIEQNDMIQSSTTSNSQDFSISTSTSTSLNTNGNTATRSWWKAIIGRNVNVNGTQTIGNVTIGDRNFHFKIKGGRDVIFNTYITPHNVE